MDKTPRTVGEIVELARQLKELGVIRCKAEDIEFEFAFFAAPPAPVKFTTPEQFEEEAKKIRKQLNDELYEAS
jgi:DsbC/DsbD-like thiol-disulfide interchange protein